MKGLVQGQTPRGPRRRRLVLVRVCLQVGGRGGAHRAGVGAQPDCPGAGARRGRKEQKSTPPPLRRPAPANRRGRGGRSPLIGCMVANCAFGLRARAAPRGAARGCSGRAGPRARRRAVRLGDLTATCRRPGDSSRVTPSGPCRPGPPRAVSRLPERPGGAERGASRFGFGVTGVGLSPARTGGEGTRKEAEHRLGLVRRPKRVGWKEGRRNPAVWRQRH
jgi:hypothetical protein